MLPSEMIARSARRQTVRATCSRAESSVPAGMMKVRSGGFGPSNSSIQPSASATSPSSIRWMRACCFAPSGVARSAPMSKSRDCIADTTACRRPSNACDRSHAQSTSPSTAFSSSTVPYASIRGWSFDTRAPLKRPVVPSSPVRV